MQARQWNERKTKICVGFSHDCILYMYIDMFGGKKNIVANEIKRNKKINRSTHGQRER